MTDAVHLVAAGMNDRTAGITCGGLFRYRQARQGAAGYTPRQWCLAGQTMMIIKKDAIAAPAFPRFQPCVLRRTDAASFSSVTIFICFRTLYWGARKTARCPQRKILCMFRP